MRTVEARSYARKKFEYRAFAACNIGQRNQRLLLSRKKKIGRKKSYPNLFWNVQKRGFSSIFSPPQGKNFEDFGYFLDYSPPPAGDDAVFKFSEEVTETSVFLKWFEKII